jgi:hypothetical protein
MTAYTETGVKMTIRETLKTEIDTLPDNTLNAVRDFVLFQKYRAILEIDDTTYLNAIPGMVESIKNGIETPISECVPLSEVWADV